MQTDLEGSNRSLIVLLALHAAMFCAFLFGFLPTILHEDVAYVVAVMAIYCLLIEAIQLALLYVLGRLLPRHPYILTTALALTTLINAIVMYYGYSPFFLGSTPMFRLGASVIGFGILFFIFFGAARARNQRVLGFGLAAVFFLSALVPSLSVPVGHAGNIAQGSQIKKWTSIKLKQKPNVHLISFDSMMPAALAKKFLNVFPLAYHEGFERPDALILKDVFTTRQGSWNSLNAILKLDDQTNFPDGDYLNGIVPSPLFELFRANGYKTASAYAGIYFGRHGPYLDRYDYLPGLNAYRMSLCKFQAKLLLDLQIGHFAFCEAVRNFEKWTGIEGDQWREWPAKVMNLIHNEPKSTPWLTLHYIYNPIGHTDANHITGNPTWIASYRKHFLEASEHARALAVKMVDEIRKDDPNAVIFVFGDHGTWLSRTITYNDDPTFFVQDRYGVFGVLPKTANACSTPDLTRYNPDFVTLSRVVASIIRCLAANPDEVDNAVHFEQDYDLKKFVYE